MKLLLCGSFEPGEEDLWREALAAALPEAQLLDSAAARACPDEVLAAIVANPPPCSLQGLPRLKLIQSLWAGVDRLLADTTLPRGVPLARMVDPAMNAAMAETALWALLALHRGFFRYAQQQRERQWLALPQRASAAPAPAPPSPSRPSPGFGASRPTSLGTTPTSPPRRRPWPS